MLAKQNKPRNWIKLFQNKIKFIQINKKYLQPFLRGYRESQENCFLNRQPSHLNFSGHHHWPHHLHHSPLLPLHLLRLRRLLDRIAY